MTGKRPFDFVCATLGLLVFGPLMLAVAAWVKADSQGPVLFRQVRIGRYGRPFRIFKFRTMVTDAEKHGGQITPDDDCRITRCGKWLRKLKLDELPQLLNVLRGEMSLVGPRPEVPRYVEMYTPEQRQVLECTPGITDPASVHYRNEGQILSRSACPEETYVKEIMPEKIRLNLEYARTATLWSDTRVIVRTLFCLIGK
jgi:lipopolysaccharide/colanic/teichoic acid biosynthesis glycosyltransferase